MSLTSTATPSNVEFDDTWMSDEWEALQAVDDSQIDNASLYRIAENSQSILNGIIVADFLFALILGVILCSIFSRSFYLRR